MPAELSIAGFTLSASDKEALAEGTLSDDVLVQFVCQTGPGEHDPNEPPDDRVRPSHAAFHGKVFSLQDAPVPPLDYGCRCAIRYVAKPGTVAAQILPDVAPSEPTTPADATEKWLKDNVPELDTVKRAANAATVRDSLSAATTRAKKIGISNPRTIAEMVVDILTAR